MPAERRDLSSRQTQNVAKDMEIGQPINSRDAKPFQDYSLAERNRHMCDAADEIAEIAAEIAVRKEAVAPGKPMPRTPAFVHISGLPETFYERLVGRDAELKRLDEAWSDQKTNILSLVAEGGAGKSAFVNEWLTRLQADGYRGADCVLGWSFYSQGLKVRATAADEFLNWALAKLGVKLETTTSAAAKGEAIAEALMKRCALIVARRRRTSAARAWSAGRPAQGPGPAGAPAPLRRHAPESGSQPDRDDEPPRDRRHRAFQDKRGAGRRCRKAVGRSGRGALARQ